MSERQRSEKSRVTWETRSRGGREGSDAAYRRKEQSYRVDSTSLTWFTPLRETFLFPSDVPGKAIWNLTMCQE